MFRELGKPDDLTAQRTSQLRRVLLLVLVLNFGVAFAKLGYGLITGSVAMSADGAQSLLDGLSNVIGLVAIGIAARPPDEEHHYGHHRYETIGSLIIAFMMAYSMIEIIRTAINGLIHGESPEVNTGSFVVLASTMTVNVGVFFYERKWGKELHSDFLTADAKHTLSDVFVSLGVVLGLIAVSLGFDRADSLISLAIAGIIGWTAWTILRDASLVLTDATHTTDPRVLMEAILQTDGVETAHKLRARSMGGQMLVEVDITVDPALRVDQAHDVASRVERSVRNVAGQSAQAVVHVEPAIAPHTRPDALFGDVRVVRPTRSDEGTSATEEN